MPCIGLKVCSSCLCLQTALLSKVEVGLGARMRGLELLVFPYGCGGGHWNVLGVMWYAWMKPLSRRAPCSAPTGPVTGAAGAKAEWQSRPGGTAVQPVGHCLSPERKAFSGNILTTCCSQFDFFELKTAWMPALFQYILLQLKCRWRHHNANLNTFLLSSIRPGTDSLHILRTFKLSVNHASVSVTTCENCAFHDPLSPLLLLLSNFCH